MSDYRRAFVNGGCYFFTAVTRDRAPLFRNPAALARLHNALEHIPGKRSFRLDAWVILPDHIHCIWTLPHGDADYSTRWRLIKHYFTVGARGIFPGINGAFWQPGFWEHVIRDDNDYRRHLDYIHYNPVKHGYTDTPRSWPESSFSEFLCKGLYDITWGETEPGSIVQMDLE